MELSSSYLKEKTTVEVVRGRYDFDSCEPHFRADWERLLSKKRDGDELWLLEPPKEALELWGIALVRDGRVVSTLIEAVG
jgi:hypothetical protein